VSAVRMRWAQEARHLVAGRRGEDKGSGTLLRTRKKCGGGVAEEVVGRRGLWSRERTLLVLGQHAPRLHLRRPMVRRAA
jgi:hypothetical protein